MAEAEDKAKEEGLGRQVRLPLLTKEVSEDRVINCTVTDLLHKIRRLIAHQTKFFDVGH